MIYGIHCPHFFVVKRNLIEIIKQKLPQLPFIGSIHQWKKFYIQFLHGLLGDALKHIRNGGKVAVKRNPCYFCLFYKIRYGDACVFFF